jgi:hypothetical protein
VEAKDGRMQGNEARDSDDLRKLKEDCTPQLLGETLPIP